ncbi:hypothetical protein K1T71_004666 [Dendrolimus kikuchii]|uniref:Uncharacterized protein n=1 Tax=Dendrolimus kikuchii TaxID=765133 RepID=A0ACC1D891_9NEOP|nr:hypothetical protein K1T71_004666 [Dendrolimus kikuchii]
MSQRLLDTTKWLFYLLAIHNSYLWTAAASVTVRTPPSNPATIQAQAKFFQDFFSVQLSPYKFEFGHVCEDPNTWEQRYEKKDFKNHRDMGKVRWGDKKGGYGEHYWDLNHAGHAGNHGNDDGYDEDGSYHQDNSNEPYEGHNNHNPIYGTDEYDSEKTSRYDETGRAKRAHPRIKPERRNLQAEESKQKRKEVLQTAATHQAEYSEEDENENQKKKNPKRQQYRKDENEEEYNKPEKERNQVVLVVTKKDDAEKQSTEFTQQKQPDMNTYVPYEGGAGVRHHQQPEASAANTIPRLFLEPSTGHVVDRATGQAYILQPVNIINYN